MTWFYPSYGRAQKCASVVADMRRHGSEANGVVLVSEDDPEIVGYRALTFPDGWALAVLPAGQGWLPDKLNYALKTWPNESWYGWVADDLIFRTDFEGQLVGAAGRFGIASANDLRQSDANANKSRMHGAIVFGGDFLRALGYWVPSGLKHLYTDDAWELIGRTLGNWRVLMQVITEHDHPLYCGVPATDWDATYRRGNSVDRQREDYARFKEWAQAEAPADIIRVSDAIDAARWPILQRAQQRSLMIVVFCYDKPSPETMDSVASTCSLLTRYGIKHCVRRSQGMSLLPIARNYAGKQILDSEYTDLLMVDDDMSWTAWDVIKLLASPQDVIAGVGKRKDMRSDSDMTAWCFSLPDDFDGDVEIDEFGAVKVARVGTAFLRIRREVFAILTDKRPDLWRRHIGGKGEEVGGYTKAFAITDIDGIEAGEDYSFCNLWRECGGTVWIDPTIRLTHWGRHGFTGEVSGVFKLSPEEFARQLV